MTVALAGSSLNREKLAASKSGFPSRKGMMRAWALHPVSYATVLPVPERASDMGNAPSADS